MPVIVHDLEIKAEIRNNSEAENTPSATPIGGHGARDNGLNRADREKLIGDCVEQVLQRLALLEEP